MRMWIAGSALAATLTFAGSAQADFVINFTDGALGVQPNNPQVFAAAGAGNEAYTISAAAKGSAPNGHPAQLYVKAEGPGESGLALINDPNGSHGTTACNFIQLNFTALKSLMGSGQVGFSFCGVDANEGFNGLRVEQPESAPGRWGHRPLVCGQQQSPLRFLR